MTLKQGTTLQGGKYIIKKVLGQGGFGITYLAEHTLLGANVAIKEFFMKELNNRDEATSQVSVGSEGSRELVVRFKAKFLKEARNIFKLSHPNIIRIFDIFEENGTAYYVMEYCDGGSLLDLIKLHPNGIPEEQALTYIRQVASAVAYIHEKKMNHLDIKPGNIVLNAKGEAVLIDFGLSKQYDTETGEQTSTTPVGISEGYAPMEQCKKGGLGEFSPATDIYALGATLYKLITGKTPPHTSIVNETGLPPFSATASVHKTIEAAMRPLRIERPQSVKYFLENLAVRSDEDTIGLVDPYKAERERLMREAAAKAAKEKAEEEARARAREESSDRDHKKVAQKRNKQGINTPKVERYKTWFLVTIISIVLIYIISSLLHSIRKQGSDSIALGDDFDSIASIFESHQLSEFEQVPVTAKPTSGTINGHEWVDIGLSVKWATCNVGANSPSDYGGYYAWGETKPKSDYRDYNCYDAHLIKTNEFHYETRWDTYKLDGMTMITPASEHDTARENWGGTWRMPTNTEIIELWRTCKWDETIINGHWGYKITGPNGNSIFLPASGYRRHSFLHFEGAVGGYWSSSLSSSFSAKACSLSFPETIPLLDRARSEGLNVRPVTE